jgi:hypothetical protein
VGGACGTHGRGENSVQGFGEKARRKENSEDQDVDGSVGSQLILERLVGESMEWIQLA